MCVCGGKSRKKNQMHQSSVPTLVMVVLVVVGCEVCQWRRRGKEGNACSRWFLPLPALLSSPLLSLPSPPSRLFLYYSRRNILDLLKRRKRHVSTFFSSSPPPPKISQAPFPRRQPLEGGRGLRILCPRQTPLPVLPTGTIHSQKWQSCRISRNLTLSYNNVEICL